MSWPRGSGGRDVGQAGDTRHPDRHPPSGQKFEVLTLICGAVQVRHAPLSDDRAAALAWSDD